MNRMLLMISLFLLPVFAVAEEYEHLLGTDETQYRSVSVAIMSKRMDESAKKYEKYAPVPRIALFDCAFGNSLEEYRQLNTHGVLAITAQCQDKGELPLKRVYFRTADKEYALPVLLERSCRPGSEFSEKIFGENRVDSFYLLPFAFTRMKGELVADWNRNRKGFVVAQFPLQLVDYKVPKDDVMWKETEADDGVLERFLQREFSFTGKQAKLAIKNLNRPPAGTEADGEDSAGDGEADKIVDNMKKEYEKYGLNMFRPGEYFCNGSTQGCVTEKTGNGSRVKSRCLHIGDIYVGEDAAGAEIKVKKLGGRFYTKIEMGDDSVINCYTLPGKGQEAPLPYISLQVLNKKVISIQLTGYSTDAPLAFSSIKLGDVSDKVKLILCDPKLKTDVPEVQAVRWSWGKGFSIEVKDGKVYSIKIY